MSGKREQNKRNDWSLLGFFAEGLKTDESAVRLDKLLRRLMPLLMLITVIVALGVLALVLTLAHVNVVRLYEELTRHASGAQRWGMLGGTVVVALGGIPGIRAYQQRRKAKPTASVAPGEQPKTKLAHRAAEIRKKNRRLAHRKKAIAPTPDKPTE